MLSASDMTTKPEEEYFARIETETKRKLAETKRSALQAAERDQLKTLHWMHCPKCGLELETVIFKGLQIDKCFHCGVQYVS